MQRGTALEAPDGYRALERGCTYYFLQSNRRTSYVQIVHIFRNQSAWQADLICLPRDDFEQALAAGLIVKVDTHGGYPPYLERVEGKNLREYDLKTTNAKRKHSEIATKRLLDISPLLEKQASILNAPNPAALINKYALAQGLNPQRIRFFFFSYLCFGQSEFALFPHYFNCGHGERQENPAGTKLGRPSIARGKHIGCRITEEIAQKIVASYKKFRIEGKPMTQIYEEAMRKSFKASVRVDEIGKKYLVSSNGIPIPTIDQFRYWVTKALGTDAIRINRWGREKYRSDKAADQGSFSRSVANLQERIEADAYYYTNTPLSVSGEGHISKTLAVARIVDTASHLRLGIGFSFGSENSEAYNAALFSAAIDKVKLCKLFGIEIEKHQWPSQGLSPHYITDRGPGIKREPGYAEYEGEGLALREFTPSGQGQSKAIVESAQRRNTNLKGKKVYAVSSLNVIEIIRQEIRRVLAENDSADASGYMTPEMIDNHVHATPLGVWKFLDDRARNDGQTISFDDAVRRFLVKTTVTVARDGVHLRSQKYNSEALKKTNILARSATIGRQTLLAYLFPMCVRHIWVEVNGQIIELDAQSVLREDEDMLYQTFEELEEREKKLNQLRAEHRQHKRASVIEHKNQFEQETGSQWDVGVIQRTQPKRHHASKEEELELDAIFKGKELNGRN